MTTIAYDPVLKRPGCVLIAAALGADTAICDRFDVRSWLLSPTDNMGVFEVTEAQLDRLVEITGVQP